MKHAHSFTLTTHFIRVIMWVSGGIDHETNI